MQDMINASILLLQVAAAPGAIIVIGLILCIPSVLTYSAISGERRKRKNKKEKEKENAGT